jgi:AbrB family looped-hinge helix DNA binding protein
MPAAVKAKRTRAQTHVATVTSKGQVTIPVVVRKTLGVKAGDKLRFESQNGGYRVVRDADENIFEKWRGIGSFPGMGKGRDAIVAYFRDLRGHDDLD